MKNLSLRLILTILSSVITSNALAADVKNFDRDWLFILADSANMESTNYDDSQWRRLNLPHDWAIEGDFSPANPSGNTGGALPGGIGWYRKHFTLNERDKQTQYFIDFDGVYMNSTVYVNGQRIGYRPYGYSSFRYDITKFLNFKGENVIAVKVDNSDQPNSRWYSGCGIYRHVYLVRTPSVHIAHWGTKVVSTIDDNNNANVNISVSLENNTTRNEKVKIVNTLLSPEKKAIAKAEQFITVSNNAVSSTSINVSNPKRWSTDSPVLYTVKTEVFKGGKTIEIYETTTGFRSFRFDAKEGFFLNGKNIKINGVCQHHDLGSMGAAMYDDALYRQLKKLKDMGCNGIRCSHNPPSPELLNMCDSMGFIVMDECFDMWRRRKTQNDYARFFDEWYERDLSDLVLRDRNHPSIFMYSLGNEVLEQWSSAEADTLTAEQANMILNFGHDASTLAKEGEEMSINSLLTRRLAEIIKQQDDTRYITAGCNEPDPNNHLFRSGVIDIIGFNYHHQWVKDVPKNFPGKPFIFSESVSALQTRGFYNMPSDSIRKAPKEWWLPYTDPSFMCSAYDNMHASWSSTHEQLWDVVKHTPYCSGQYIWTGWDYIGEPTPYQYPARSSYFGIIDLAGFPKDVYYMYQSEWTDKTMIHLFPHWNWIEGQTVDLWCYYNNADEVELFVNGKSKGISSKTDHVYHAMWRVEFEPGEVKVVSRKNGKQVAEQTIKTAGAPSSLRLSPDRKVVSADGKSLVFVEVEVTDKDGNLCPNAENQIFFSVEGPATIASVDNGSQFSMERFKDNKRKAFFGKCLVILQTTDNAGEITLTAKGVDLKTSRLKIESR